MTDEAAKGERIAKVMARAGVASRRDAERLILEGRVAVNGETVKSPARDILATDRVTLDGKPIDAPQPPRLWLYYKPLGLVTSTRDEKGRQTVFDTLPDGMPRVMSIGRLDLTSEGLLLLTNDGGLKRRLELPSTGWLRKYRVRVNGRPNEATFDPLRRGVTIEGEDFLPMEVTLDRQQGANAWLTVGLREGRNREIRRAMAEVGLTVNRLIRVSYGPFRLNTMKPGDIAEVKARILRDQLGPDFADILPARAGAEGTGTDRPKGPRAPRKGGERRERTSAGGKGAGDKGAGGKGARAPRTGDRPSRVPWAGKGDETRDKPARGPRAGGPATKAGTGEGGRGGDGTARAPRHKAGADAGRKPPRAKGGAEGRAEGRATRWTKDERPPRGQKPEAAGGPGKPASGQRPRSGETPAGGRAGGPRTSGPGPKGGARGGKAPGDAPAPKGGDRGRPGRGPKPGPGQRGPRR